MQPVEPLSRAPAVTGGGSTTSAAEGADLAPLTPSVARILTEQDRDNFGGVPESD